MTIDGEFILLILLLLVNLFLCIRRIPKDFPLINIIVALFSIVISVIVLLPSENIPANPYMTAFLALLSVSQLLVNVLSTKI